MKWYFKILAIVSVLALIPLQYVMLSRVYKSLEKNLCAEVDECFRSAVEEEAMIRFYKIIDRSESGINGILRSNALFSIMTFLEMNGSSVNLDTLNSLFASNLSSKELHSLLFRIEETDTDTSVFKTADDFLAEDLAQKSSLSRLVTHTVPVTSDLSKGVRAVVTNPHKAILPSLKMLIIFSMLILLFVLFSLYKMIRTLNKVNFINNLRKDHTYAMIHDMKTPLSSIMIIAEDFKDNPSITSDPDTVEQLKILDDECRHLNQICEKVINVAKVDNKKLKFVYEKIDLQRFFDDIQNRITMLYPSALQDCELRSEGGKQTKAVDFETDLSQERWLIADPLYLKEIIDNLIDNSIKYSGESVKISVRSVKMGNITELRLKDNGRGFSREESKRLFKKFERGENTVGISGHGIGLNYVYQLMKFFGGYVKIDSQLGEFTEVILGFPSKRQYDISES